MDPETEAIMVMTTRVIQMDKTMVTKTEDQETAQIMEMETRVQITVTIMEITMEMEPIMLISKILLISLIN